MPKIHKFDSTGIAYNASQTRDDIKDGDVLSVSSERVVGVLIEAWPTAISEAYGEFHVPAETLDWAAIPTTASGYEDVRDYSASFEMAIEELDRICMEIADAKWQEDVLRTSENYKRETE